MYLLGVFVLASSMMAQQAQPTKPAGDFQLSSISSMANETAVGIYLNLKDNGTAINMELVTDDGEVLLRETKEKKVILTVYRDGHVVASDPTALNKRSVEFWKAFAAGFKDTLSTMCSEKELKQ